MNDEAITCEECGGPISSAFLCEVRGCPYNDEEIVEDGDKIPGSGKRALMPIEKL